MFEIPRAKFFAAADYQPILRQVGLDAEAVFTHPDIVVWRQLSDRENCTLDAKLPDRDIRLHIKRYQPARGYRTPAEDEVQGIRALQIEKIPTIPLVGWGALPDGRSFVITEDLTGFQPADKLIAAGLPFDRLLEPTAALAARLHQSGLHHRDLYLCHFFAKADDSQGTPQLRLIDAARVARLGGFFFRRRWIVKDLAQFWYSTLSLPIDDAQRSRWLEFYARQRNVSAGSLRAPIERKSAWIARHDEKLKSRQPNRNISIPDAAAGK